MLRQCIECWRADCWCDVKLLSRYVCRVHYEVCLFYVAICCQSESFLCVVCNRNPFLDISTDESIMVSGEEVDILREHEYDEWGDPRHAILKTVSAGEQQAPSPSSNMQQYIQSYSPCNNVKVQQYPSMLMSVGLQDIKVSPLQSLRYCQLVYRANAAAGPGPGADHLHICHIQDHSGHAGPLDLLSLQEQAALEITFLDHVVQQSK